MVLGVREVGSGDLHVLTEVNRKLVPEAVDNKIKQVLFVYLTVCLVWLHILSKQTLTLTRCDRLNMDRLFGE